MGSEAELSQLHACPAMNGLKPGQDLVVKAILVTKANQGANAQLAEHEPRHGHGSNRQRHMAVGQSGMHGIQTQQGGHMQSPAEGGCK